VVTYERFKLALQRVDGTQWRVFERLATVFLGDEYPSLRPMASESGDDGMDATLFQPDDDPDVVLQFSVRHDWEAKVNETCKRLEKTAPDTRMLVFATNQEVGPKAGQVKKRARSKYGMFLDIKDIEWFLAHRNRSPVVAAEAASFSELIADPILSGKSAFERQAQALDDLEAKAAFVYLGLQWQDETREKGLTKLCFEAIVRAVLRDTTSDERMSRAQVKSQVAKLLPAHHAMTRDTQVDGALARLSKVQIRHWKKPDEFCLTWAERERLTERLTQMDLLDAALSIELRSRLSRLALEAGVTISPEVLEESTQRTRAVLERVLLDRGEAFAEAVTHEHGAALRFEDVEALVYTDLTVHPTKQPVDPKFVAAAVQSIMIEPSEDVRKYLRSLADTYTLFAFMRETPDVQSAILKIFSDGDIWLDTTVVLPLFVETLLDEHARSHKLMLAAALESGLRLYVTEGVVEELFSHIQRCKKYYHAAVRGEAYGRPPFLLASYEQRGKNRADFDRWLETFCGSARPEDDIIDYLSDQFGIDIANLHEFAQDADPILSAMVGEVWHEARDERDRKAQMMGIPPMDQATRSRLVAHDVENYVGVIMRRQCRGERRSAFGYKSWWLTMDSTALRLHRELESRLPDRPPASPAISPDFMLNYLAVGPVRSRLSRRTEEALPLMLNMSVLDAVPQDLLDVADTLRKELAGLPPHVVRRKIRDALDEARMLLGERARAGEQGLTDEIKRKLVEQARKL